MEQYELDELDEKILSMMVKDARKPFLEVARECNVSGAAIHQRIQKLIHAGVVKGSEFIIDNSKIGFKTCAYMGLFDHRGVETDSGDCGVSPYDGEIRPLCKDLRQR